MYVKEILYDLLVECTEETCRNGTADENSLFDIAKDYVLLVEPEVVYQGD